MWCDEVGVYMVKLCSLLGGVESCVCMCGVGLCCVLVGVCVCVVGVCVWWVCVCVVWCGVCVCGVCVVCVCCVCVVCVCGGVCVLCVLCLCCCVVCFVRMLFPRCVLFLFRLFLIPFCTLDSIYSYHLTAISV